MRIKQSTRRILVTFSWLFSISGNAISDITHRFYQNSANFTTSQIYVNFATTNSANLGYDTWNDPNGHSGVKFASFEITNSSSSGGDCFEVSTFDVSGSNVDTRIYAPSGASTWASVSDDYASGMYWSLARMWVGAGQTLKMRVQGYSSYYNNWDFGVSVAKLHGMTSQTCPLSNVPFLLFGTGMTYPSFYSTN